jgi:D-3-phosphoglycerate dehydrogenase
VEKLAQVATALADELPVSIDVKVLGDISVHDCSVLATSALKGALIATGAEDVTYVNAPGLAAERGLTSAVTTDRESLEYRSMISLHAAFSDGQSIIVNGTLMGIKMTEKIIQIDNFDLDLAPTDHLLFLKYVDRPGVVGTVGNTLGRSGINIAGMQVARDKQGGEALMAITVDSSIDADLVELVKKETGSHLARVATLVS